jgi:succinate dehydrogenase/fumarate reductase flavoprotein subunit
VDLVVVGLGAAGLSAAITAHDAGASVIVLEKAPEAGSGGNSRVSGQVWFCPTDVEAAMVHLRALCGAYPVPEALVSAWAHETARNTDWLSARAREVRGRVPRDPADPYDGDGTDFCRVSWGETRSAIGFPGAPEHEFPDLEGNECGPEYNFIGGSMGFSRLWLMLMTCLARRRIPVHYGTAATSLIQDHDGRIVGVEARDPDGQRAFASRLGVILASGGFAASPSMTANFLRLSDVTPWGSPACTGDGVRMAQRVGADLAHPYNYMAVPGVRTPPYATGESAVPRDGRFVNVGADGRRFGDETNRSRHGKAKVRGTFDFHPGVPMWTVFDEDGRLAGPLVLPRATYAISWMKQVERYDWSDDNAEEIRRGWIAGADTLPGLAGALGIDPHGLGEEIERYNAWALAGTGDPVFGRPPSTMAPICRPPFYGFRWAELLVTTLGGIRKDERARVVDPDGVPIAGLYCAGDVSSTYSWCLSGGMALGDALAFGRIAARTALEDRPMPVP